MRLDSNWQAALEDWPTGEAEALAVQEQIRHAADLTAAGPDVGQARTVAGVDVAYAEDSDRLVAAAVVLNATTLQVMEKATFTGKARFPYISGLLAFRELPPVIQALGRLSITPDLVICDGYGLAHPRRAGLAVHLGVMTGLPCFGVAKSPFAFDYTELAGQRGAWAPLTDEGGEIVGRALRTQDDTKPVFVSVGHRIDLDNATAHTLALTPIYRQPETTRAADQLCRAVLARG